MSALFEPSRAEAPVRMITENVMNVLSRATTFVLLSIAWFMNPTAAGAQAVGSCWPAYTQCKGFADSQKSTCRTNCNGNASCLSQCDSNYNAQVGQCQTQFNSCVQMQSANCYALASGSCSGGAVASWYYNSSTGYCSFTCGCAGSKPACPNPVCTSSGAWVCESPVLLDILGDGFQLTAPSEGVVFDLHGDGEPRQYSWTSATSDDAWLALDRDENGVIDDGTELFGSATDQLLPPEGDVANGFIALAVFDENHDGFLDERDPVYYKLRLWRDVNHNGMSEPGELVSLREANVGRIDLQYVRTSRQDRHGNVFRYKARVWDCQGAQIAPAWDVFLRTLP